MESVFTMLRRGQTEPGAAAFPGPGAARPAPGAAVFSVPLPPAGADGAARPFRALPEGGNALPPLSVASPPAAEEGADAALLSLSGPGQAPALPDLVFDFDTSPATPIPGGSLPALPVAAVSGPPADPPLQPTRPLDGDSVTLLVAGEAGGAGLEITTTLDAVPAVDPSRPADQADAGVPAIATGAGAAGAVAEAADVAHLFANRAGPATAPATQLPGSDADLRLPAAGQPPADLAAGVGRQTHGAAWTPAAGLRLATAGIAVPAEASSRAGSDFMSGQQGAAAPVAPSASAATATPAGAQATPMTMEAPPAAEMVNTLRQVLSDLARDRGAADGRRSADPVLRTEGGGLPAGLSPPTTAPPALADRPAFLLPTPPGSPQFAEHLGERIVWMAGQKLDRAQIRLNPAHLGPISVDLAVGDDGASVTFTAHHAATRDALEQALPRLRELFSESGLQLAGADVSGQQDRGGEGWRGNAPDEARPALIAGGPPGAAGEETGRAMAGRWEGGRGLIDTYV